MLDRDQRDSQGVHVTDGPSGHDGVGHGFLELPELNKKDSSKLHTWYNSVRCITSVTE